MGTRRPPYVVHASPALAALVGGAQVGHRHRVGAVQAAQCLAGGAGGLAVHRGEHGDLGRRPVDAELRGHRRVQVVVGGRRRPAPGRRRRRPGRAARSARGRRAPARGRARHPPPAAARPAGCAARPRPVIRPAAPSQPRPLAAQPAVARRRGGRASRSRRSSRPAPPCARRAARSTTGCAPRNGSSRHERVSGTSKPTRREHGPHLRRVAQVDVRTVRHQGAHRVVASRVGPRGAPPRRPVAARHVRR